MLLETEKALAAITDEGLFERIATAVLRTEHPLCAAVCHPGVTADGKTQKSALDGIGIVATDGGRRLVALHHTTSALKSLQRKWLHDPDRSGAMTKATSRVRRSKSAVPAGDLVKTAALVREERVRAPNLRATLILTTNQEPGQKLLRDVHAAADRHQLDVEVWSRTRIAHFLDTTAAGHSIRRMLGIECELLSPELLIDVGKISIENTKPTGDDAWVCRTSDGALTSARRPLTVIVAESGMGKTVACIRALEAHARAGGFALVVRHDVIDVAPSIEHAVLATLRELHPTLRQDQNPLALCSVGRALHLLVEDVNTATNPSRILKKLVAWTRHEANEDGPVLRVLCPVSARTLAPLDEHTRKALEQFVVPLKPLSLQESREAVLARSRHLGMQLSDVMASAVAATLGHDPLLIGVFEEVTPGSAHSVIQRFIEGRLAHVRPVTHQLPTELFAALLAMGAEMLRRRNLDPRWGEVARWGLPETVLDGIRAIAQSQDILRVVGVSAEARVAFRHDRVRDWLLVESASQMDCDGKLEDEVVEEPFFAEILGAMLVKRDVPVQLLSRLQMRNPLALFCALRFVAEDAGNVRRTILDSIQQWIADPVTRSPSGRHKRWHAVAALEATDMPEVLHLLRSLDEWGDRAVLAALHNGAVDAGIELCARYEFDSDASFRDHQITHAKLRFGDKFINEVAGQLEGIKQLKPRQRRGLIELVGHLQNNRLVPYLESAWASDADRDRYLSSYLWAFARCCDSSSAPRCLAAVCALWGLLPNSDERSMCSQSKDDVRAELERGFSRNSPSSAALEFLVNRARFPDLEMHLGYVLRFVDHPIAVSLALERNAARLQNPPTNSMVVTDDVRGTWRRNDKGHVPISKACRALLLAAWKEQRNDRSRRVAAFRMWSSTTGDDDLDRLRESQHDLDLADRILVQRLVRSDRVCTAELVRRVRDRTRGHLWWPHAHYVWSEALRDELDRTLTERQERYGDDWTGAYELDRELFQLMIRIPQIDAERALVRHWKHLQRSRLCVQLALYVATPSTVSLATNTLADASDPASFLKHIGFAYGVRIVGHPGVTRKEQMLALQPFVDLLDSRARDKLADACNMRGWFEIRRNLFDRHLTHRYLSWFVQDPLKTFDDHVAREHPFIGAEIDHALGTGVTWDEFIGAMKTWLRERRSLTALELVADAIIERGTRADLDAVLIFPEMDPEMARAIIADATFAVRRRTLR